MNIKKPLALLLAAGMTLGLAACGNGSQGNSESPAPGGETGGSSSGTVELNLWSFNVGGFAEASNWEPIIAAFNEQNPNIKITVTPINYQDGDQKLTSAITAGTGPDIIFEGPERIVGNYAREGLMVDLSDLWETGGSDIAEGISSVSQLDGTSYLANSENNVKALKLLQDMVNNGSMSANASFAAADELQAFANQTCAVSFCWNYANYTQYAAQTQFTPFAMAFPSDDGKPELEMAGPYGFGVFNNKDEAKIEAAKKFVQFVCDDQTVGVEAVKATGFFPVHSDWGDVYTGDADAETRAPFALMSDYLGRYYNLTGGWTEQRGYWWPMLTEIMTTGADVQTAADKYAAQANANIG